MDNHNELCPERIRNSTTTDSTSAYSTKREIHLCIFEILNFINCFNYESKNDEDNEVIFISHCCKERVLSVIAENSDTENRRIAFAGSADTEEVKELLLREGQVLVNSGTMYGKEAGEGFIRINLATPRSLLAEGLDRIVRGLAALSK